MKHEIRIVCTLAVVAGFCAGVRAGAQNLLVSLVGNTSQIDEYTSSGTFVKTFVPNGTGGLTSPWGMTFGPDKNLYVTGAGNSGTKIFEFDGASGAFIRSFGSFYFPSQIVFGKDGSLYVADAVPTTGATAAAKIDTATGAVVTSYHSPGMNQPNGVGFRPDNGDLLVADTFGTGQIQEFNPATGAFIGSFGAGVGAAFHLVDGPDGRVYELEYGGPIRVLPGSGGAASDFISNTGHIFEDAAFDSTGLFYAVDGVDILKYSATGAPINSFEVNPPGSGTLAVDIAFFPAPAAAVPEPGTTTLLIGCALTVGYLVKRRAKCLDG